MRVAPRGHREWATRRLVFCFYPSSSLGHRPTINSRWRSWRRKQQFPKWKLFYTKNSKGIYSVVIPKITPEMALQIDKIGGSDDFEIFNSHYRAFTKIINMLIINKSSAPMKPILEMYSQASEYFESCLMENSWNHDLTSDYVDGMTWVFTECCPEGFSFDGERYVEDG